MLTKKMLKNAAECVALRYNMNKLEQTIRDLQLYNDVGWDEINDMFNFALTALREKAERKLDDNTIEAMRKHIEALQAENEQLQARLAQYRDALIIANNYMPDIGHFCTCGKCKRCGTDISYSRYEYCLECARGIIDAALSDTPADYHNPADVEALRKAREAIKAAWSDGSANAAMDKASEALAEIDRAIGGKEDV